MASIRLSVSLFVVIFCQVISSVYAQPYELITRDARLIIDKAGNLIITSRASPEIIVKSTLKSLLKLTLKSQKDGDVNGVREFEPGQGVDISQDKDQITLAYDKLKKGDFVVAIRARFRIAVKNDAFVFSASLGLSSKEWLLKDLTYPILNTVQVKNNEASVYWPEGLGQRFDDPAAFGKRNFDYPSGKGSMQWFTINTDRSGLYFACHDGNRGKKLFNLGYAHENSAFYSSLSFPIYQNYFDSPEVVVHLYEGKWHQAAKRYRAWYNTQFKVPQIPAWVSKDPGCLNVVFKQQNGLVMWRYSDLDKLCDIAGQRNLKTIALFGWTKGGLAQLYPDYVPDELLGGRTSLMEAIERAHRRGFRIILDVDGTAMDVRTDFYLNQGNQTIALDEGKSAYLTSVRKYNSFVPTILAEASYSSKIWRKAMLDLALQARELGADGILYGQIGVQEARLNFSKIQDHLLPQESGTKYRYQMLNEIRTTLKNMNEDFVIMTEGINDAIFTEIDYYQGWGNESDANSFPGLFKYTFPELVSTRRHSAPFLSRTAANYAVVTGQRHQIESQWEADSEYLLNGKPIITRSYSDETIVAPDIQTTKEMASATKYMHDIIKFENKHAEFFRSGKYTDVERFTLDGKDMLAGGFQNGDRLGILVWNKDKADSRSIEIDIPGYRLVETSEPEGVVIAKDELLKPNSIRLLVYVKK